MAGQFAIGSAIFNAIASGTIAVIACAVIACAVIGSVTVLPAVIALLGRRMDAGVIPFLPHLGSGDDSKFWPKLVGVVLRRPAGRLAGWEAAGGGRPSSRARPPPRWSCSPAHRPRWRPRARR
jgi:RND superfamily putative drug exporter